MKSKKKNYLTYLNEHYFYEIGFVKKESKLKDLKMEKRQYRSNQGRSPKKEEEIFQLLFFISKLLIVPYVLYLFVKECYENS